MEDFFDRLSINNYPDMIGIVSIPLILAILTIAFPLLSTSWDKVKNKYKSRAINKAFDREVINLLFNTFLISSLVLMIVWLLQLPAPNIKNTLLQSLLNKSALILLFSSTLLLAIFLFVFIRLLNVYHNPDRLINRFIKRYTKRKKGFKCISELFYFSINEEDETLSRSIISFLYEEFYKYQNDDTNEAIVYPTELYELIYKSNMLISKQEKKLSSIFNSSIMFDLVISDFKDFKISNNTYSIMWRSLLEALFYDNQTIIFSYWKSAHQTKNSALLNFNKEKSFMRNDKNAQNKLGEIERYKEFHYVLGALLLYKEKYKLLLRCITFSQSKPIVYQLVPNNFIELIEDFLNIKQGLLDPFYYESKQPFPDLSGGVDSNDYIVMWINRYFALLFIRQYQLKYEYTVNFGSNNMPSVTGKSLNELSYLKERMEILKWNVEYYLKDEKNGVLKELDLTNIGEVYVLNEGTPPNPEKDIEDYIKAIEKEYNRLKETQSIAKTKEEEFKDKTVKIIDEAYKGIGKALNKKEIKREEIQHPNFPLYIGGMRKDILPRGAFATNQDILYMGTSSITAKGLSLEMKYYFASSFERVVRKTYAVYRENLFDALNRLQLNDEYIIIDINVSLMMVAALNNEESNIEIEGDEISYISQNKKKIQIVSLSAAPYESVNHSLFILKHDDLPSLIKHDINDINNKSENDYMLDILDGKGKIYGKIIDLNKEDDLKEKISETYNGKEKLSESVLSVVAINYELRWKKEAKAIQIQIFSSFERKGDITKIEDIEAIK